MGDAIERDEAVEATGEGGTSDAARAPSPETLASLPVALLSAPSEEREAEEVYASTYEPLQGRAWLQLWEARDEAAAARAKKYGAAK